MKKRISVQTKRAPMPRKSAVGHANQATRLSDRRALIQYARQSIDVAANSTHTMLCWHVGLRLLKENLYDGRAAHGKRILATVSQKLTGAFGQGFSYSASTRMDVEQVELLQLDAKSIRVSEYLTELPPPKLLRARLHQAVEHAREQNARRALSADVL